jgi:ubiquinone/menaquinone biosynthesis C-methylase UbiE
MLNLIDDFHATALTQGRCCAMSRCMEVQQEHLAASSRWPYRPIATTLGALYSAAIAVSGALVRMSRRQRPDALVRDLAEHYCAVPEMIVHKAIELRSLVKRDLSGKGLDLGCGTGFVGEVLIRHASVSDLAGVDMAGLDELTLRARGYSGYTVADIQHLPQPDASFDYVVSICVIEHVPDVDAVLAEALRVLRAGGRFYFTTPSPAFHQGLVVYRLLSWLGLKERAERFRTLRDIMSLHHRYFSAEEWCNRLERVGFTDITIEPIFTRGQHLAYDAMNVQVYFLKLYFYEHINRWTQRWSRFRRLMVWSSAELASAITASSATEATATHYSIACRKASAAGAQA